MKLKNADIYFDLSMCMKVLVLKFEMGKLTNEK